MPLSKKRPSLKTILLIILIVILCVIGISSLIVNRKTDNTLFTAEYYKTYAQLKKNERAIFLPGSGANEARQKLHTTLERTLVGNISPNERFDLAQEGIRNMSELQRQLQAAKQEQKLLNKNISELSRTMGSVSHTHKKNAEEILFLVENYYTQGEEALSFLEKTNTDIKTIFSRIIKENGSLSETFITELNDKIPEAEETANSLFNTYIRMEKTKKDIEQRATDYFSK